MKKLLATLVLIGINANAQLVKPEDGVIYVNKDVSTHFISSQKIKYTDLSTSKIVGDFPLENVIRIKPKQASGELGYITVIGEGFVSVFKLEYSEDVNMAFKKIILDNKGFRNEAESFVDITSDMMKSYSKQMLSKAPSYNSAVSKKYGMKIKLNNIWVVKNKIFVDYSLRNKSNLPYKFDEVRYKIEDRKITKRTSVQEQEINAIYHSSKDPEFLDKTRVIAVFDKFTFPDDKTFSINITEDQISGRTVRLDVSYKDILAARTLKI